MGKKQDVVTDIFNLCNRNKNFVFNNDIVKKICRKHKFSNPFDATKLDSTSKFPKILLDKDYFITHLGKGLHRFVKGIKYGFHIFEEISDDKCLSWKYRKSILNELDTSESSMLSFSYNQKIIHDFLYDDITANPRIYNSRRTKRTFSYFCGKELISANKVQMEIDLTMELNGKVTIFEGKNGFPKDFAVYQLFHPFRYYLDLKKEKNLDVKEVSCCYVLKKKYKNNTIIRLYNYIFENENNIGSIRLLKNAQYNLIKR